MLSVLQVYSLLILCLLQIQVSSGCLLFVGIEWFNYEQLYSCFHIHRVCIDVRQMYFNYVLWNDFEELKLCYTYLVLVIDHKTNKQGKQLQYTHEAQREDKTNINTKKAYCLEYVSKLLSSRHPLTVLFNTTAFSKKSGSQPVNIKPE